MAARWWARGAIAVLVAAALAAAGLLLLQQRGSGGEPIPSIGGASLDLSPVAGLPYYLQNDPAWGADTLGESGERMASAGCTVSSIAMGLSAFGWEADPGELCAALGRANGFTDSGQVIWAAVEDVTGGAVRLELPNPRFEVIDAELSAGRPVVVKILLGGTVPHWLLVVGKEGREYLAQDPLNQGRELVRLSARSAAIEAVRVFR